MFENFKRMLGYKGCDDKRIETLFWLLAGEHPDKVEEAIELLAKSRPQIAKKLAADALESIVTKRTRASA